MRPFVPVSQGEGKKKKGEGVLSSLIRILLLPINPSYLVVLIPEFAKLPYSFIIAQEGK